uniref:RING-type domain-containing protein n=1 Tax=Plectus sambesii TaxID=2011161 RepID=A0A914XN69_9BILA
MSVVLDHFGEQRRLSVRNPKPGNIARMFRLAPDSVWLLDSQNLTCLQSGDRESFDDIDPSAGPFTVNGDIAAQPPLEAPTSSSSSSSMNRPPVAPPFGVIPGARTTGNPPPGLRNGGGRRGAGSTPVAVEPANKVLKITKCANGKRRSLKPGKAMTHVIIGRDDCNVPAINAKMQAKEGFEDLVIADRAGVPICDDECTRDPAYWYLNKGQAGNAVRYYAVKPRTRAQNESSDSDSDEFEPPRKIAKMVARCLAKEKKKEEEPVSQQKVIQDAVEAVQSPLREALSCSICHQVSREPTICTGCGQLVGCYVCVLSSLEHSEICPLGRCQWNREELSGFVKSRLNFDNIPGL